MTDYGPTFEQRRRVIYLPHYTRRVPLVTRKTWPGLMFVLGLFAGAVIAGLYGMPAANQCVHTPDCVEALR